MGVGGHLGGENESTCCHGNQETGASQENSWVLQQGEARGAGEGGYWLCEHACQGDLGQSRTGGVGEAEPGVLVG